MPLDDAARYDIDLRLRQKEGEFQQAILLANGVRVEVAGRRWRRRSRAAGQGDRAGRRNNGAADVNMKQIKLSGFDSAASCTLTAPTAGGGRGGGGRRRRARGRGAAPHRAADFDVEAGNGRALRAGRHVPATARVSEPVLASRGRSRALHVRRRCAVRSAVPADTVPRPGRRSDRRRMPAAEEDIAEHRRCGNSATRATSSAGRNGPSCSSSPSSRCASRRRSPSSPVGVVAGVADAVGGPVAQTCPQRAPPLRTRRFASP